MRFAMSYLRATCVRNPILFHSTLISNITDSGIASAEKSSIEKGCHRYEIYLHLTDRTGSSPADHC